MADILYISKHDPWSIGGGAAASRMYLDLFSTMFSNFTLDLCIADSCTTPPENLSKNINVIRVKSRSNLSKLLSCISGITHRYQNVAKNLLANGNYKYIVFDHNSIAGTLLKYVPHKVTSFVIHHNFEQNYFRDNTSSKLHRLFFSRAVAQNEKKAYRNCDINIFLTAEDLNTFENHYGICENRKCVIGLIDKKNVQIPKDIKYNSTNLTIAITGSLCNIQNIDGIKYFSENLLSRIPDSIKIIVAGKNPTEKVRKLLSDPRITLVPNPKDMYPILSKASIFLCPTRLGGGIKVRVSDGLSYGIPILAHSVSAKGYSSFENKGYLYSFSTPEEFSEKLSIIINKIRDQQFKKAEIVQFYKNTTSIERAIKILNEVI